MFSSEWGPLVATLHPAKVLRIKSERPLLVADLTLARQLAGGRIMRTPMILAFRLRFPIEEVPVWADRYSYADDANVESIGKEAVNANDMMTSLAGASLTVLDAEDRDTSPEQDLTADLMAAPTSEPGTPASTRRSITMDQKASIATYDVGLRLYRLVGIVWILVAIRVGFVAVFWLGMAHGHGPGPDDRTVPLLLAAGALIAAGNGILGLFRPSPRVALWSVASAVALVAVSVVFWVAISVVGDPALASEAHYVVALFGPWSAAMLVLSGLALSLSRRPRSTKRDASGDEARTSMNSINFAIKLAVFTVLAGLVVFAWLAWLAGFLGLGYT